MKVFSGPRFAAINSLLAGLARIGAVGNQKLLTAGDKNKLAGLVPDFVEVCDELGLLVAAKQAARLVPALDVEFDYAEMGIRLSTLEQTIDDEIGSHLFMYLEPTLTRFYLQPHLFGESVKDSFPSTELDIEEAGKCLALNRDTACVFHLMRVLEVGLYALAHDLGIEKVEVNWQNAIEQIEKEIRGLPKGDERIQPYSEAAAHFMHVKDAWRNRTAHAGKFYSGEKAQQIFDSVKGLMQTLASRLGE